MNDVARVVAITGAAGRLGRLVLRRLLREPSIERLVAIDAAPQVVADARIQAVSCDVRNPDIGALFAGCDALIHLAFVVEQGSRDLGYVESVNIAGTQNTIRAALDQGVEHIIHASSIAAYGFHPDNDGVALREDAPLRGNDNFYYAQTKAQVDRWLIELAARTPEAAITTLRPSLILGPRQLQRRRFFPYIAGAAVPVHLSHEEDVVEAFLLALQHKAEGAFNIATRAPLPIADWPTHIGSRGIAIPACMLWGAELAYRLRLMDIDPIWFRVSRDYPINVDAEKARRELGWQPRYPTASAVLRALGTDATKR